MFVYCGVAKVLWHGTDSLHYTNESKEHELRALDQARFTTDGIHFDSLEGQAWMNRLFQEQSDELEVKQFDTGALRTEKATFVQAISTSVHSTLETRSGSVLADAVPQVIQSSREQETRSGVLDRSYGGRA